GTLTKVRLKQDLSLAGLTANLWQEELQPFDFKIWQNNLNCQIIYKAKKLNLTISTSQIFEKYMEQAPFTLNLSEKNYARAKQRHGLVQSKRSTLPTSQTGKLNQGLDACRREENSITIRWVVKKRKREVLVEHWQDKNVILKRDKMKQVLEKCDGCELNSNKGKEVCLSWIRKEDIQEVYPKIQNMANQKVLLVPKEVIAKKKTGNVEALASNLLDPQLTVEASLARYLERSIQILHRWFPF
ncbi:13808_t:CDS:2, partial [Gigaspora margarita]